MQYARGLALRYRLTKWASSTQPVGVLGVYPIHSIPTPWRSYTDASTGGVRTSHRIECGQRLQGKLEQIGFLRHSRRLTLFAEASPTVYALSSAPGRSAIAIVRCSGSLCLDIYRAICPGKPLPKPRYATVRSLFAPSSATNGGQLLDSEALVLYFPTPRTVTGEDVLEFHVHGGNAIVKAVLAAIYTAIPQKDDGDPLVRYAEPGEFTRRAFYNDRLDLTQVEALGDTLAAETEQQRRLAVRGMSNVLHERYEAWRQLLLAARGELEALIDFSEDQHFDDSPAEFVKSISSQIVTLQSQISTSLTNAAKGELLRNGIRIALLGAPNAGKSSLLNQIVGREAAIVSAEAGTTRDVLETNVDIGGFFCTINDLAGIRAVSAPAKPVIVGEIEREGIRRAKESALAADIIVTVTSFKRDTAHGNGYCAFLDPEIEDILRTQIQPHQRVLHVLNKLDLLGPGKFRGSNFFTQGFEGISSSTQSLFPVSCLLAEKEVLGSTSEKSGLQSFLTGLTQELKDLTAASAVAPPDLEQATGLSHGAQLFDESLGSTERQRRLLEQCSAHLSQFLVDVDDVRARAPDSCNQIDGGEDDELDIVLAAERLRAAAECLAKVTGRGEGGDVEEVLGIVFEKFCVGK